ncbi:MAG: zinc ribbon domain-containing protein [Candidatus Verstraetearchaeota archaeon]|nr:zinc ribbon domain-containing protein [Candidatus Verstraetearchaeota archaeon]
MQDRRVEIPSWVPEKSREMISRIAFSLRELGYDDGPMLWEAARRMSLAPALVEDMFAYISAGKPKLGDVPQDPPMLTRRLPGNYTVASLIRDLGLKPAGAFLLATELINNPQRAMETILKIVEEGYCEVLPDGKIAILHPPVSRQYPSCPSCGRRWTKNYETCPTCGYDKECRLLDAGEIPKDVKEAVTAGIAETKGGKERAEAGAAQRICKTCGTALKQGSRFCEMCGTPVPTEKQPQETINKQPIFCEKCGAKIKEGARFCESCGAPVSGRNANAM